MTLNIFHDIATWKTKDPQELMTELSSLLKNNKEEYKETFISLFDNSSIDNNVSGDISFYIETQKNGHSHITAEICYIISDFVTKVTKTVMTRKILHRLHECIIYLVECYQRKRISFAIDTELIYSIFLLISKLMNIEVKTYKQKIKKAIGVNRRFKYVDIWVITLAPYEEYKPLLLLWKKGPLQDFPKDMIRYISRYLT